MPLPFSIALCSFFRFHSAFSSASFAAATARVSASADERAVAPSAAAARLGGGGARHRVA